MITVTCDAIVAIARGSALNCRMATGARVESGAIVMAVGGAIAALLYAWFLSADLASVHGDAVVGQAMETLTALGLLWLMLLILMLVDRWLGGPSWPRRAGFLLAPLAGVATLFATDYPGDGLARTAIIVLPLLIGAYLLAGRLAPRPAARAQFAILLPVAALCAYAFDIFLS